ncbi:MAG: hypothetical protein V1793_21450, partial [Pseudomonadota bacterium]
MTVRAQGPGVDLERDVEIGCPCAGESCDGSSTVMALGCIDARFRLGKTGKGLNAGDIFLHADTADPANTTPAALRVYAPDPSTRALYQDDVLRQIVAPEVFVNITPTDAYAYTLNFFRRSAMGTTLTDGLYNLVEGAVPVAVWRVENPDGAGSWDRLRITRDNALDAHEFAWDGIEQTWTLKTGDGLQVRTLKEEEISGVRVVTRGIESNDGVPASKTETTYGSLEINGVSRQVILREVTDPDTLALTTVKTWYDTPGEDGYGRIRSRVNPDGSWVRYEYDAKG